MAINVSGQSICDPEFAEHFTQQLKKSKLPQGCIVVEVTEQVAGGNLAKAGRRHAPAARGRLRHRDR
jgi:EAL domain-containing protein (putative c-di-GMP-specific phosphodiesterase class I)